MALDLKTFLYLHHKTNYTVYCYNFLKYLFTASKETMHDWIYALQFLLSSFIQALQLNYVHNILAVNKAKSQELLTVDYYFPNYF